MHYTITCMKLFLKDNFLIKKNKRKLKSSYANYIMLIWKKHGAFNILTAVIDIFIYYLSQDLFYFYLFNPEIRLFTHYIHNIFLIGSKYQSSWIQYCLCSRFRKDLNPIYVQQLNMFIYIAVRLANGYQNNVNLLITHICLENP